MSTLEQEAKRIVRLARTSLEGTKPALAALLSIKGVGLSFAHAVLRVAGIDPFKRIGEIEDEKLAQIEDILMNPARYGISWWMLNRKKDYESGENLHFLGDEIRLVVEKDIKRMKAIRSWKGIRHHLGLKVRGQRTKTTGRTGRTIGYKRKKR